MGNIRAGLLEMGGGGVIILTFKKLEMTKYFNHGCDPDPNYIYSCFFYAMAHQMVYMSWAPGMLPPPRNCKWPNILKTIEMTTLLVPCARGIRWYVGHEPWGDPDPLEPVVPKYFENYTHPITIILVSCVKGYQLVCR